MPRFTFFVFALLMPLASLARADFQWTLVDSQFHSQSITVTSIDADGVHGTVTGAASPSVLKWDDVLEMSRPVTSLPTQGAFDLYLTTGDRIVGEPVTIADEKLKWKSPTLGEIDIPLSRVAAIARSGKAPAGLDDPRKDDTVQLANGDVTHGIIAQLTGSSVTIQTGDASPTLSFDAVTALLFSTPPGTGGAATRSFRVRLSGDTSVTVADLSLTDGKLTVKFDEKTSRDIDILNVTAIEQLDGPVSWLTSRRPAENIYKPFFEENFPTRFEKTVADAIPIPVKFPGFRHGIGCHSYSKLVYDLDGKYAGFRTQFAVDSDSAIADVTVRIKLDDKVIVERKNIKAGKVYPLEIVPLADAKTLTLEVDYGENYASEDRFAWLDPALVRALPPVPASTSAPATQPAVAPQ